MRFFIYLSYDGAAYHGWQVQPNGISVQETLQKALSLLLRENIEIVGAGRTDAGVNAELMVAHFDFKDDMVTTNTFVTKLNKLLPQDISVWRIVEVKPDAHARFDATARTYKYYIVTEKVPFCRYYSYRFPLPLDFNLMNEAAKKLFNYSDFTSFSKLHTDAKTNICRIMQAEWKQKGPHEWVFTIQADRFLRNMVRAIVGTLLDVGRGKLTIEGFCGIIEGKDRCMAGTSVPGNALFLSNVEYPESIFKIMNKE